MRKTTRRPTHLGSIIKEDYLAPLSVTIEDMAATLGVSRTKLSKIVNEEGAITPERGTKFLRITGEKCFVRY